MVLSSVIFCTEEDDILDCKNYFSSSRGIRVKMIKLQVGFPSPKSVPREPRGEAPGTFPGERVRGPRGIKVMEIE